MNTFTCLACSLQSWWWLCWRYVLCGHACNITYMRSYFIHNTCCYFDVPMSAASALRVIRSCLCTYCCGVYVFLIQGLIINMHQSSKPMRVTQMSATTLGEDRPAQTQAQMFAHFSMHLHLTRTQKHRVRNIHTHTLCDGSIMRRIYATHKCV